MWLISFLIRQSQRLIYAALFCYTLALSSTLATISVAFFNDFTTLGAPLEKNSVMLGLEFGVLAGEGLYLILSCIWERRRLRFCGKQASDAPMEKFSVVRTKDAVLRRDDVASINSQESKTSRSTISPTSGNLSDDNHVT